MQSIAIPAYFYPVDKSQDWAFVEESPEVKIVVINPNSGPGKKVDPSYAQKRKALQERGIKAVGYVHTQYGKRKLSLVLQEIEMYYTFYSVDGIFLDEIANTDDAIPYYANIRSKILAHKGASLTILNPGTQTTEGYMKVADIICNYEDNYQNYVYHYQAPSWVAKYPPNRFWHIVHSISGLRELSQVCRLSKERNAGLLFATSEVMPNPYGKMPSATFWTEHTRACQTQVV